MVVPSNMISGITDQNHKGTISCRFCRKKGAHFKNNHRLVTGEYFKITKVYQARSAWHFNILDFEARPR